MRSIIKTSKQMQFQIEKSNQNYLSRFSKRIIIGSWGKLLQILHNSRSIFEISFQHRIQALFCGLTTKFKVQIRNLDYRPFHEYAEFSNCIPTVDLTLWRFRLRSEPVFSLRLSEFWSLCGVWSWRSFIFAFEDWAGAFWKTPGI